MSKRKTLAAATLVGAVLAATGAAAAHRAQGTQAAAASFDAGTVAKSSVHTCTAADGTYQETTAVYRGTATSSDPRLSGPVEIKVHSMLNTTTQLGWLQGTLRIRGSAGSAAANLDAALAGGRAVGVVRGQARKPEARLVASFSSSFSPSAGFSAGQLGAGSTGGAGVLFARGDCRSAKRQVAKAVFRLHLTSKQAVPPSAGLKADAAGSLTLDVTRDASGAITSGNAVFSVNYRFPAAVTLTSLQLHQAAKGAVGPVVVDAGLAAVVDADGRGNVTQTVTGVAPSVLQAILASPRGYYVDLTTSAGTLRAQLDKPATR